MSYNHEILEGGGVGLVMPGLPSVNILQSRSVAAGEKA